MTENKKSTLGWGGKRPGAGAKKNPASGRPGTVRQDDGRGIREDETIFKKRTNEKFKQKINCIKVKKRKAHVGED